MLAFTIPPRWPYYQATSSHYPAWRVAMICLLAWTTLATKPLPAIESVLSLVGLPAPIVSQPADQARAGTTLPNPTASKPQLLSAKQTSTEKRLHSSQTTSSPFHRLAVGWRSDWSDSAPTTLPPPVVEQLAGTPKPQFVSAQMVANLAVDISLPAGTLPRNVAAERTATSPARMDHRLDGRWAMTTQPWAATNLRYQPLYFEEINLERYGYTSCRLLQPLISAARFFVTIPALPYKMVLQRPCRSNYALGHNRPGSRAPWYWQRLPLHARAGLVEAGIAVGLVFLIP